jgi:uncharacterized membrane protein
VDLGTGLFVSIRALDSLRRDLRRLNVSTGNALPVSKEKIAKKSRRFEWSRFLAFFVVGVARVAFVELSDYGQDPKEYGTHWNFFITLAFIEVSAWASV